MSRVPGIYMTVGPGGTVRDMVFVGPASERVAVRFTRGTPATTIRVLSIASPPEILQPDGSWVPLQDGDFVQDHIPGPVGAALKFIVAALTAAEDRKQ